MFGALQGVGEAVATQQQAVGKLAEVGLGH
jgi:hypothetical protein